MEELLTLGEWQKARADFDEACSIISSDYLAFRGRGSARIKLHDLHGSQKFQRLLAAAAHHECEQF